MNAPAAGQNLVIVGASGMVGGYALRYALDHPAVERVTAIGRKTLGISHPKLMDVLHETSRTAPHSRRRSRVRTRPSFAWAHILAGAGR
jgi:N-acetyl-gamma-glutamylphosphate reductase